MTLFYLRNWYGIVLWLGRSVRKILQNGKKYYSYTFSTEFRWQNGYGYKKQKVGEVIEEFGWENVEKKIIAENLTRSNAQMLERSLVKAVGTDIELLGYNIY